ncbi:MAG: transposase [Roseivirga sp.]
MKDRFNEAQIINIIKEQERGIKVLEICRKHAIAESTFDRWKATEA